MSLMNSLEEVVSVLVGSAVLGLKRHSSLSALLEYRHTMERFYLPLLLLTALCTLPSASAKGMFTHIQRRQLGMARYGSYHALVPGEKN